MKKLVTVFLVIALMFIPVILMAQDRMTGETVERNQILSIEKQNQRQLQEINNRLDQVEDNLQNMSGFGITEIIIIAMIVLLIVIGVIFKVDVRKIVKLLMGMINNDRYRSKQCR